MSKIVALLKSAMGGNSKQPRRIELQENEYFSAQAKKQFERLQKKGLSIPIITI